MGKFHFFGKVAVFLIFFSPLSSALLNTDSGRFSLKTELSRLLDKAPDLHNAFQKGDPDMIRREVLLTQGIIKDLYGKVLHNIPHLQRRTHALRLLKAIEGQLEALSFQDLSSGETAEKHHRKRLFNSFVELARVYNLENTEKQAFYCHLDKSAWIQSGSRPENPVSPHHKNCGRRVW